MSKNREYTGLVRTPSSMAWLIRHRAKIKGQLDRAKHQQASLPEKIKGLEDDLAAIDAVIPLHEVKVDAELIRGTKVKGPAAGSYGALTRFLLNRLRVAAGQPLYTAELALQFARETEFDLASVGTAELINRVAKRLGVLTKEGLVRRHHALETRGMGMWSLVMDAPELAELPQSS